MGSISKGPQVRKKSEYVFRILPLPAHFVFSCHCYFKVPPFLSSFLLPPFLSLLEINITQEVTNKQKRISGTVGQMFPPFPPQIKQVSGAACVQGSSFLHGVGFLIHGPSRFSLCCLCLGRMAMHEKESGGREGEEAAGGSLLWTWKFD